MFTGSKTYVTILYGHKYLKNDTPFKPRRPGKPGKPSIPIDIYLTLSLLLLINNVVFYGNKYSRCQDIPNRPIISSNKLETKKWITGGPISPGVPGNPSSPTRPLEVK